jgi:hypothetical protein
MGFHPPQVPLLRAPKDPQPLGGLVGLAGDGSQRVLAQRQPVPGRRKVMPAPPATRKRGNLLGGGLVVGAGLLARLLGLGRPLGG